LKKLVSLAALAAVVLAACGGGSNAIAATLNGVEITVGEVEALIDPAEALITKEEFAQFLGFEIQWRVVKAATKAQWGIEIAEGEIDAEADRIYETANAEETREDFLANRNVTELFLREIAQQGLLDIAVRAELVNDVPLPTQDEIDAEMSMAVASLTDVCVSHILVATAEEAQDVFDRLDAGEDFGALAVELSQDTGSGENDGILPCGSAGQYVPEFRDAALAAPLNEVYTEAVESEFGFHIMLVTDRVDPDPDVLPTEQEVSDTLHSTTVGDELNIWFLDLVGSADVIVDVRYGTWVTEPQPGVAPPSE